MVKKKMESFQTNKEVRSLAGRKRRRSRRPVYILFINVYEFSATFVKGGEKNKRWRRRHETGVAVNLIPASFLFYLSLFFLNPAIWFVWKAAVLFNDDPWHAVAPGTSPSA